MTTTLESPWHPVVPADGHPPRGAYSPGTRVGNLLFVSGQVPRDPATGTIVNGGIGPQTEQTLANLKRVLEAGGATLADVVSVTVWLQDIADWGEFDAVYRRTFQEPFPARAVVGAQLTGVLVEIACVAAVRG
jgi:2-iminobutanoate/2-iminopropanoate deaminase